jgi:hypothetical protein
MAGGLDLFPSKITLLRCKEIRPSIKAVRIKQPMHPQISLDPFVTIVGFRVEPLGFTKRLTEDSRHMGNLLITETGAMIVDLR